MSIGKKILLVLIVIFGGAIGNIIDRINYGAVVDFLDFHIKNAHWPAFNVADSCIFIGVICYIIRDLFVKNDSK